VVLVAVVIVIAAVVVVVVLVLIQDDSKLTLDGINRLVTCNKVVEYDYLCST
jgi:hypothetical protein